MNTSASATTGRSSLSGDDLIERFIESGRHLDCGCGALFFGSQGDELVADRTVRISSTRQKRDRERSRLRSENRWMGRLADSESDALYRVFALEE